MRFSLERKKNRNMKANGERERVVYKIIENGKVAQT
jgi:hypothetical protein